MQEVQTGRIRGMNFCQGKYIKVTTTMGWYIEGQIVSMHYKTNNELDVGIRLTAKSQLHGITVQECWRDNKTFTWRTEQQGNGHDTVKSLPYYFLRRVWRTVAGSILAFFGIYEVPESVVNTRRVKR